MRLIVLRPIDKREPVALADSSGQARPLPLVASAFFNAAWAILPEKLDDILAFIEHRAVAGLTSLDAAAAQRPGRSGGARAMGSVAVLPLHGTLLQRVGTVERMSGATSLREFTANVRMLTDDPQITAIVIDVDSPGGTVSGTEEAALAVRAAAKAKPTVAVANGTMASAAYWIGSQAREVVASPSSLVGSIGVVAVHRDRSKQYAQQGVHHTAVYAGRYKAEGADFAPLGDEAKTAVQQLVDAHYRTFVTMVAKARNVSVADVINGYGQGRALDARAALRAGMVDRLGTLEDTTRALLAPHDGATASLEPDEPLELPPAAATAARLPSGRIEIMRRRLYAKVERAYTFPASVDAESCGRGRPSTPQPDNPQLDEDHHVAA